MDTLFMFESILMAPPDPVLGLSKIYNNDKRKDKINLGIGVYINKTIEAPVLMSVKKAEEFLLKQENNKNYLNIEGIEAFNKATQDLLFKNDKNITIIPKLRIRTVQAPGGTGALRIAAECIARNSNFKRRIWISDPSWINHRNIFSTAGLEVQTYPYYDKTIHDINFDKLLLTLNNKVKSGDIVLLHGCCHNPTGMDPNIEQWKLLSECSERIRWIPLFDLAYQGFDSDLKSDLKGLHIFCKKIPELIICNSYSKNFGLYNERVGACTIITNDSDNADRVLSQLRSVIRSNYSSPPSHGASVVSTILNNTTLRSIWENELKDMRLYIKNMRELFLHTLKKYIKTTHNFNFIKKQRGMFTFMSFDEKQVMKLREEYGIYLVGSGRINLAGLSQSNIVPVCKAIFNLLK